MVLKLKTPNRKRKLRLENWGKKIIFGKKKLIPLETEFLGIISANGSN